VGNPFLVARPATGKEAPQSLRSLLSASAVVERRDQQCWKNVLEQQSSSKYEGTRSSIPVRPKKENLINN